MTICISFCNLTFLKLLPSKIRHILNEPLFIPLGLIIILRHRVTKFRYAAGDMNYTPVLCVWNMLAQNVVYNHRTMKGWNISLRDN